MSKKKLFLVETLVCYKQKYVIEEENLEYAKDAFISNVDIFDENNKLVLNEIDQIFLGEIITETKEISKKEFKLICKTAVNGHLGEKIILKDSKPK